MPRQIRGNREINGVFFTIWSAHETKTAAKEEAVQVRNKTHGRDTYLARVVKSKEKGIKYPWIVYYGVK